MKKQRISNNDLELLRLLCLAAFVKNFFINISRINNSEK